MFTIVGIRSCFPFRILPHAIANAHLTAILELFAELEIQPSLTESLIPAHARGMVEAGVSKPQLTNDLGAGAP